MRRAETVILAPRSTPFASRTRTDSVSVRVHDPALEEVGLADELGGEPGRGRVVELLRPTDLFHPPLVQQHDPVRHFERLILVVRDVDG